MQWIEQAQNIPVAFAQVREDPELDRAVLNSIGERADIIMIASGGCTLTHLVDTRPNDHIRLVDANPAQMQLALFKLQSLALEPTQRQQLLCTASQAETEAFAAQHALSITDLQHGDIPLNQYGRYEMLFAELRKQLATADLDLSNPACVASICQEAFAEQRRFSQIIQQAFDLDTLVALFGDEATQNPLQSFSDHFYQQSMDCMASGLCAQNYFFEDMFLGYYRHKPQWLQTPARKVLPQVTTTINTMLGALQSCENASADFIHLSNILDWLCEADATILLNETNRVLRPGGYGIIRQLNSSLDIPKLISEPLRLDPRSQQFTKQDRSFFYRHVFVLHKPCT